jgi:flagellin-like hook-associated protein FlgL
LSSALTINSNISSLQIQRRLDQSAYVLNRTFERLSTGQRINRASDDAAGLAIADSLRADLRIANQAIRNGNDGISMLSIVEGAVTELGNIITRIQELSEQAGNGIYSNKQRSALDLEAQQLVSEYNRIVATTQFNDISLLADPATVGFQVGNNSTSQSQISVTLGLVSSVSGDGTFQQENVISGGGKNVTSGDFNRDGFLDVAYTGSSGSGILLGNGNGTFKTALALAVGVGTSYSNEIKTGDMNGDGVLDLIIPGYYSSAVSVLIGNGNGYFKAASILSTAVNAWEAEIADFNNDGFLDIVSMSDGETIRWTFLGNGDGTFKASISANAPGYQLAAGDVNGDGNIDLVRPGLVYLGNGDGNFSVGSAFSNPGGGRSSTLADFNGDSFLDFASSGPGGTFGISLGNGNGTFKSGVSFVTGAQSFYDYQLTAGDLNGDGRPDVIIAEEGGNSIGIFLNNGNGTFAPRVSYLSGAGGNNTTIGDFNGDGAVDIVESKAGSSNVGLFLGNPSQTAWLLNVDLKSRTSALTTLDNIQETRQRLSKRKGELGAQQSRISAAISNLMVFQETEAAAESQIRAADIAQEATNLTRNRILQQASAAILAQANTEPSLALTLIQGI